MCVGGTSATSTSHADTEAPRRGLAGGTIVTNLVLSPTIARPLWWLDRAQGGAKYGTVASVASELGDDFYQA
jgi:hypothetical protein